jgi:hypothetical protein
MRTAEDVQHYLEGVNYPAGPEDLTTAARANGVPPIFFELLGLLPTAAEFYGPGEAAEQLERIKGLV